MWCVFCGLGHLVVLIQLHMWGDESQLVGTVSLHLIDYYISSSAYWALINLLSLDGREKVSLLAGRHSSPYRPSGWS